MMWEETAAVLQRPPAKEAMKYSAKAGLGGQRNPIII